MIISGKKLRNWNICLILLATLLCLAGGLVSLSRTQPVGLPDWLQVLAKPVGGHRVLDYQLDLDALQQRRLDILSTGLAKAFEKAGIAGTSFRQPESGVLEVVLGDPLNLPVASTVVDRFKTGEFDLQTTEDGVISFNYTPHALDQASRHAVARFVATGGVWASALDEKTRQSVKIVRSGSYHVRIQVPALAAPEETSIGVLVERLPQFSINFVRQVQALETKLDEEAREVEYDRASGGINDLLGDPEEAEGAQRPLAVNIPQGTFIAHDLQDASPRYLLEEPAIVTGAQLALAKKPEKGQDGLEIILSPEGKMATRTAIAANRERELALVLDHVVLATFAASEIKNAGRYFVQLQISEKEQSSLLTSLNLSAPVSAWILTGDDRNDVVFLILGLALGLIGLVMIYINYFNNVGYISQFE